MSDLPEENHPDLIDPGLRDLYRSAQTDSYCIIWYDFEPNDWQGWTRKDFSAQEDNFFHVDDFHSLGGGDFGGLEALEGTKSMWCGARPGTDEYMCSWVSAPGYGNDWNQMLMTDAFTITGVVTFSYQGYFDSEPGYDYTYVEYDAGGGNWMNLATYEGRVDTIVTHEFGAVQLRTKLRFHFVSDVGFSDHDGWYNSDGAVIVDSITVADFGGPIDFEDFEAASIGDKDVGIWHSTTPPTFGMYSGLRSSLRDKDPCRENFSTQIVFFVGSPSPSGSYPGLFDTPFCTGSGGIEAPCQNERVISPVIDMTRYSTNNDEVQDAAIPPADLPELGGLILRYTSYMELPLDNVVFLRKHIRRIDPTGCPGVWSTQLTWYFGGSGEYWFREHDISDFADADSIQIALGIWDMCSEWYPEVGNCAAHAPSPWLDNVRVYRYKTVGPIWGIWPGALFQDNFPEDEFDLESYVRADAGKDSGDLGDQLPIDPFDAVWLSCDSPLGGGIAEDEGGPRVYCHVRCTDLRPTPRPNLYGPQLEGNYGHYVSDDGSEWTILQCQSYPPSDGRDFDLNDSLFTRGYMIEYYFKAYDNAGYSSTLPDRAESHGTFFEWTCLPTGKSDILYIEDHCGAGAWICPSQLFYDKAFETVLPITNQPDRYDVNHPGGLESSGPGGRAKINHLTTFYNKIIWDSGSWSTATIADGTINSDKSNDCQMLIDWMNTSENNVGLFVCGNNIAYDLDQHLTSPQAVELMSTWCGVSYAADSYYDLTGGNEGGGITNPLITGAPSGIFWHGGTPNQLVLQGGCPGINAFDVLEPTANGVAALMYPDFSGDSYIAGIQAENTNAAEYTVRTMWFGFSFGHIVDPGPNAPIARNVILRDVLNWMDNITNPDITDAEIPRAYNLAQNFPNPFNPITTIKFDMKAKGHVSLKVYNVAGQLVRTLVNEMKDAGYYTVTWDGSNNSDAKVASGVYFYKMDTKDFSKTRKLVLLR